MLYFILQNIIWTSFVYNHVNMFYVFSIFTYLLYLSSNTVVLRIFCDIGLIPEDGC